MAGNETTFRNKNISNDCRASRPYSVVTHRAGLDEMVLGSCIQSQIPSKCRFQRQEPGWFLGTLPPHGPNASISVNPGYRGLHEPPIIFMEKNVCLKVILVLKRTSSATRLNIKHVRALTHSIVNLLCVCYSGPDARERTPLPYWLWSSVVTASFLISAFLPPPSLHPCMAGWAGAWQQLILSSMTFWS